MAKVSKDLKEKSKLTDKEWKSISWDTVSPGEKQEMQPAMFCEELASSLIKCLAL